MPKKLERCVTDVMRTGKSKSASYAICTASIMGKKNKTKKK